MKCPFPIIPKTKSEREDYAMIEESVLENERKGDCFIRVYPNAEHLHLFRNFFEEERRNDNILHSYVFSKKYKNMHIDINSEAMQYENLRGGQPRSSRLKIPRENYSVNPSTRGQK